MTATPSLSLEQRLKDRARELGFDPVGITALGPAATYQAFASWIDRGYAGEMTYLPRGAEKRRDTRLLFEGAKSAVVVGLDYGGKEPDGPVARYARGDDYHDVMMGRLNELHRWLASECGRSIPGRPYVDTAPILERDLAQRAGLGWIGKNTMLVNPRRGSFFFLGALFIDLELEPDAPFVADRCGSCTRCLDACPTDAFVAPRLLDARRCISYLTIEHRSEIAPELQPFIGEHVYGCDVCQDVCPWNVRFAQDLAGDSPFGTREILRGKDARTIAHELLALPQEEFPAAFRKSPMKRARLRGLKRNAAVVLGNVGTSEDTDRPQSGGAEEMAAAARE